jgi:5,10-methylenetetrahydrofolate reductase
MMGNSIGKPTQFSIGVAVNPAATDVEEEIGRIERKVAAGAQFAMTQPLYDLELLDRFLSRIKHLNLPVLLGLLPLQSYRHAEFLHNEVPGIEVPRWARDRLRDAGKDAADAGIRMCRELLSGSRGLVQGAYLMPSFGRYETVLRVLQ